MAEHEILFDVGMAHHRVCEELGRLVGRSTFYVWRQSLNMPRPPYTQEHIKALVIYGKYLALGLTAEEAKEKTIERLRQEDLSRYQIKLMARK